MKINTPFLLTPTLVRSFLILGMCCLFASSFAQNRYRDLSRRKIFVKTDEDIVESEVYEGIEEKIAKEKKTYYWFDHNMIMTTKGGYSGELLHGQFECQYRNYQLKERGNFSFGLKVGKWKRWHTNGELKETIRYRKGLAQGRYYKFDSLGRIAEKGKFQKGKMNGTISYYVPTGLVAKNKYKNGVRIFPSEKKHEPNLFTKLFTRTQKDKDPVKQTPTKAENKPISKQGKTKSKRVTKKTKPKSKKVKLNSTKKRNVHFKSVETKSAIKKNAP